MPVYLGAENVGNFEAVFFLNTHLHLNWQVAFSYINLHGRLIKCRAAMSGREREKDRN